MLVASVTPLSTIISDTNALGSVADLIVVPTHNVFIFNKIDFDLIF